MSGASESALQSRSAAATDRRQRPAGYWHPNSPDARKAPPEMRTFALTIIALLLFGSSPLLSAQKKVEAGLFLDYLSISQTSTNNFGVGGRVGFRVHPDVMMEGELAYDYGINFQQA